MLKYLPILFFFGLASCAQEQSQTPLTQQHVQYCQYLKHQLADTHRQGADAHEYHQAFGEPRLIREYKKNRCDQVE